MTIADDLKHLIHRCDPYTGFPSEGLEYDLSGWFGHVEITDTVIDTIKPKLLIEVGTWKGSSAVHFAKRMKGHQSDCAVICVDTWLGSREHWQKDKEFVDLKCVNGFPSLYKQFLYNVIVDNLTDTIIPLPLASTEAAALFGRLEIEADVVYLDAGHELHSVTADLEGFWPMIKAGGTLMGDDYRATWPGVVQAVDDFISRHDDEIAEYSQEGDKFVINKKV